MASNRCWLRLSTLSWPPGGAAVDVVLVVNAGDPATVEAVVDRPGVTLLSPDHNLGFAAGSNLGAAAATGVYVAFVNGDAIVDWDALARLVASLCAPGSRRSPWRQRRSGSRPPRHDELGRRPRALPRPQLGRWARAAGSGAHQAAAGHLGLGRNPRKFHLLERNRLFMVLTVFPTSVLIAVVPVLVSFELALLALALKQGWRVRRSAGGGGC